LDDGNWLNAKIAMYGSSGIGISNTVQAGTADTAAPQHAIDNRGVNDILVVDFGSNNWDVSSFSLGYTCQMADMPNSSDVPSCLGGAGPGGTSGPVNVDAWLGGSAAINFNNVSFVGGAPVAGGTQGGVPSPGGFQTLTLSPDPSNSGLRTDSTSPSPVGRYLIIAGSLAGWKDAFKVSGISATQVPGGPGGGTAPLPGSAPLIAVGLMALAWVSRRRAVAAR
jgi:hypothetical protein